MRAYLVSSIGVAGAAALLLPLVPAESADHAMSATPRPAAGAAPAKVSGSQQAAADEQLTGRTQSLSLRGMDSGRSGERQLLAMAPGTGSAGAPSGDRDTKPRKVQPFSLLGVVWNDAQTEVHRRIQVRTRAADSGKWTGWQELQTHLDDGPDAGGSEKVRGATAPLWAGKSDGVQVRVLPERGADGSRAHGSVTGLPEGMSLELVTPGPDPKTQQVEASGVRTGRQERAAAVLPALSKAQTVKKYGKRLSAAKRDRIGPRPGIVIRKGWGADEGLRERQYRYTKTVKAAFVHHTATSNDYSCKQAPSIIRGMYRYHVKSLKWRDIGYNFLVDKCGTIYEGRAGGVARAVMGAHTYGFNSDSTGIAVIGSHNSSTPSSKATDGVAKLTAWKLGLHGRDASGKVTMTSGGGKYRKGAKVSMRTISGHRDGYNTDCPGSRLYDKLGSVRALAGRLQGR